MVIFLGYDGYQRKELEKTPWLAYWKNVSDIDECAELSDLDSDTPVSDIYGSMAHCVAEGNYDTAAEMYYFAKLYREFDYARVADVSAHQAAYVLSMYSLNTLEDTHSPSDIEVERSLISGKIAALDKSPTKLCDAISSIGYPTYYPRYMINHGMGGFREDHDGTGIKIGFEPKKVWDETLTKYCKK